MNCCNFDTHRHAGFSFLEVMASCRRCAASCQRPKRNLQKERYTTYQVNFAVASRPQGKPETPWVNEVLLVL
jgi:hypothetical protein